MTTIMLPAPLPAYNRVLRRGLASALAVIALLHAATPAMAQTQAQRDSARGPKTLFTWRDAALAGGFTVLTVAMFPVDQRLAAHLQNHGAQTNHFFKNASHGFEYMADPGSIVIGVGMYGVGRLARWQNVADLGLHGLEAVALSGAITNVIKDVAGRARPYFTEDTLASNFKFGRGFGNGNFQSFPSGHTTAAFAAASAVTSESQRWWPPGIWIVAPAMYGGATLVGLSRMYNNKHWASDVVLGAGIGTFSGLKVVRYNHNHPGNFIDRVLLHVSVAPDGMGGGRLAWSGTP
jgi:membrane-associated phospholipid phosphatase